MVTDPLKILFVASEVEGFAKTGGLADVARALPLSLTEQGHDVIVVMPYYQSMKHREKATLLATTQLIVPEGDPIPYRILRLQQDGLMLYLIDCPRFFEREQLYAENNQAYDDNGARFAFFCAAALHSCEVTGFRPHIIHCNDWHTGLLPMLLRTRYAHSRFFDGTRSVISIHNAAFQGIFDHGQLWMVPEVLENYGRVGQPVGAPVNFLRCGVCFADKINAVSPNYAQELLTHLGAHGMAQAFHARADDLCGIINGCDYRDWDPATDHYLPATYHVDDLGGKGICRRQLQQELGLAESPVAIYGMICRLTEQKGVPLLIPALEKFLQHRVQVVIVGTGDPMLAQQLTHLAERHPGRLVFLNTYDNRLAHLVEAGADFFLMPSLFEPCGLNQMYSLAYGTLPLVRAVGGLKDTVIDLNQDPLRANGFCFVEPNAGALLDTLRRSLLFFLQEPEEFKRMQRNAMLTRFCWGASVKQYEIMYRAALAKVV